MHSLAPGPLSQAESDAITITNLRVLVRQLEQRVRVQRDRIAELEMLVGYEKRGLQEEVKRLRQALRDLHFRQTPCYDEVPGLAEEEPWPPLPTTSGIAKHVSCI